MHFSLPVSIKFPSTQGCSGIEGGGLKLLSKLLILDAFF